MEPLLRDFLEYDNNDQNLLIRKIFGLYEDFEVEFKVVFGEVDEKELWRGNSLNSNRLDQLYIILYNSVKSFYDCIEKTISL